jgi:hypothetical protein
VKKERTMVHDILRFKRWAMALGAISALTLIDPPPSDGERALLGRTPAREAGSSNLRMAGVAGEISAGRALLGKLTHSEEQAASGQAIQVRSRRVDGQGALLGRP